MNKNNGKGHILDFVTHTSNPVLGACIHDCAYCFRKSVGAKFGFSEELRLNFQELDCSYCKGNTIFVGASSDLFAENIPTGWISAVLKKCDESSENNYVFQTKNPFRYFDFLEKPFFSKRDQILLGTTIESNRNEPVLSNAPKIEERLEAIHLLAGFGYKTMVSVDPIVEFDIQPLVGMLMHAKPSLVTIGCNTLDHVFHLPEPSKEDILLLAKELEQFTTVSLRPSLSRILG